MVEKNSNFVPVSDDQDLGDLPDLPKFSTFPNGAYVVLSEAGIEAKDIAEHPAYEFAMKLEEILEVTGKIADDEELPKVGDIASVAFMVDNEFGAGNFKEFMKPLGKAFGTTNIRSIREMSVGKKYMVVLERVNGKKENADKVYQRIKAISPV